MSEKKLLFLLIPIFLLSVVGIHLSHYYSEYYVYSAWGRSLIILEFFLSWLALGTFLRIALAIINKIEESKNIGLITLAISWIFAIPYLTYKNIDKLYETPDYDDLPTLTINYKAELKKERAEIIEKKIKSRHESFIGKYTFKKYAQLIPITSIIIFNAPSYPFGIPNIKEPYLDYLMRFDTKEECEKSLVKNLYTELNQCIKFDG